MLNIIVAICHHNAIGYQGRLLCPLQVDLQRFKQLTWGQKVIMGRKTYEALPSPKLPNREKYVLTSQNRTFPDATVLHSIDDILALDRPDENIWIIGGGELYRQTLPFAHKLYVTQIDYNAPDADTFFPTILPTQWQEISNQAGMENHIRFRFLEYKKIGE